MSFYVEFQVYSLMGVIKFSRLQKLLKEEQMNERYFGMGHLDRIP